MELIHSNITLAGFKKAGGTINPKTLTGTLPFAGGTLSLSKILYTPGAKTFRAGVNPEEWRGAGVAGVAILKGSETLITTQAGATLPLAGVSTRLAAILRGVAESKLAEGALAETPTPTKGKGKGKGATTPRATKAKGPTSEEAPPHPFSPQAGQDPILP